MEQTDITSQRDPSILNTQERFQQPENVRLVHKALRHLSWLLILAALLIVGAIYLVNADFREHLAEVWVVLASGDQEAIREFIRSYGVWAPFASIALMVSQVVIAPVPASVIQLANGVVFGVAGGAVLNLIGQMAGATIAFYISRSLGRSAAERFAGRVDEHGIVESWIDRWGGGALLLVRMIPGMPSDFVSYLMGLTSMPARKYLVVSLIGYIPQSFAYAWLGDYATDWFWWIVLGGFGISSIIAIIVWALRKFRPAQPRPALNVEPERDICQP